MKRIANVHVLIVSFLLLINYSCKKTLEPVESERPGNQTDTLSAQLPATPFPTQPVLNCDYAPNYGDSVLFSKAGTAGAQFVYPVNNQGTKGTYLSWPAGLDLNAQTGAINLSSSQTGQRYSIAFVHENAADTCMSQLIMAGAAYMDSIYVLPESPQTVVPYFNANPNTANPCQNNQGNGCRFDYTNSAKWQGVEVDHKTGYIDLEKTMQHSPFGIFPKNGATILTTIHYQLDDQSNGAPQQIQVKLMYYFSRSDIPDNIISIIQNRVRGITQDNGDGPPTKPPIIIITRTK